MEMIGKAALLGMLGLYAAEDMRKHTISSVYLVFWGILGIGLHLYLEDVTAVSLLAGAAVGGGLLLLGFLTRERIGYGDGFVFIVTGLFLGGAANVQLLLTSLLYAAIFSLGILLFGKKRMGRNQEIPFIPFVFLGYLTMLLEVIL